MKAHVDTKRFEDGCALKLVSLCGTYWSWKPLYTVLLVYNGDELVYSLGCLRERMIGYNSFVRQHKTHSIDRRDWQLPFVRLTGRNPTYYPPD